MTWANTISGKPEEWNGLTVYPVLMKDYPLFLAAKESVSAVQQSWPMPWCVVPYLEGLIGVGLLPRLCVMLQLVLQLSDGDTVPIYPRVEGEKIVSLLVVQGERRAEITKKNFGSLRELVARQNGMELPDETANLELLDAKRDLSQGDVSLKADLEDLICSVALRSHVPIEDILCWTVRRFQRMERAIDRSEGHRMASITLAAGGKFKGGNPYPSWKYDREEGILGVESLSALSGRLSGSVEQK